MDKKAAVKATGGLLAAPVVVIALSQLISAYPKAVLAVVFTLLAAGLAAAIWVVLYRIFGGE